MALVNIAKLHTFIGLGVLTAVGVLPIGCSDDEFAGCEASRTCPSKGGSSGTSTGGDSGGGGEETGGTGGSATAGSGGSSGTAGSGKGGRGGGSSTGGQPGAAGDESGGESGDNAGGEGGSVGPDTSPPRVVSVSPADGAMGVRASSNLVITFSEPMDRATTQAAYQSADIPASGVTFSWNSASTVLTINPNADLRYADGDGPSVVAQTFAASITTTAEDAAGNSLQADHTWSFKTLRRVNHTLSNPGLWAVDDNGSYVGCSDNAAVGDNGTSGILDVLSFDLASVPTGIVEWERAVLFANQNFIEGTPYGATGLGSLHAYQMGAGPPASINWATPVIADLGVFSNSPLLGERMLNVLAAVSTDYDDRANRGQRSVYRLSFDRESDGNLDTDWAYFACDSLALRLTYLVP